eukprot:TRINITY_DN39703_c0_g1_i1.p2 TRINITY_DN39703_c0_g1~~TRINITY_DN39703_c0_g1_i1.p2  ORF type:complete len:156 (+),score=18.79 TRINITY_DN39703_c0_g1_i1:38-505(+)
MYSRFPLIFLYFIFLSVYPAFVLLLLFFLFFNDSATTEIYTILFVGSVRCVQETASKFDPILAIYNEVGIYHQNFQIRQKSINSLQSLFISEGKAINWDSMELLKLVENLIDKLDDNNMHVVKATEQTLLTLYKMDRFSQFKSKLSEEYQDDFTS